MTSPFNPNGEHAESLEYLNVYGQLIVDVSHLMTSFETRKTKRDSETTFEFYAVNDNFEVPDQIEKKIGEVTSANLTFSDDGFKSLNLELFGETGSYVVTRNENPELTNTEDTVFKFSPLSVVDQHILTDKEREKLPRVRGDGEAFDTLFENIPGITSSELIAILMRITHPGITLDPSSKRKAIPEEVSIFENDIYSSLIESSRITSVSQIGQLHYELLAADNTTLTYFFESGQPEAFHLKTVDQLTGKPLLVVGKMEADENGVRSMSLHGPQKATSPGATIAPDLPIDSVIYTAPTLRELRLAHEIITDEIASLPEMPSIQEEHDGDIVDAETLAVTTNIDDYVDAKVGIDSDRRSQFLDFELEDLIASQRKDDENNEE